MIIEERTRERHMTKIKNTDSSIFLLPLLGIKTKEWLNLGFINAYLADKNRSKVNDKDLHLYLLFHPSPEPKSVRMLGGYEKMEVDSQLDRLTQKIEDLEEIDKNKTVLLDEYDYEGGYIVLVLKIPSKYKNDYELFLKGQYSKFSKAFINMMPENIIVEDFKDQNNTLQPLTGKSTQWMIINKAPAYKKFTEKKYDITLDNDQEVHHLPIIEEETLSEVILLKLNKEIC